MTVAELIRKLQTYNPDDLVLLSKDEEGNGFSSIEDFSLELVELDYEGGLAEDLFNQEDLLDNDPDLTIADIKQNFQEVLILWP